MAPGLGGAREGITSFCNELFVASLFGLCTYGRSSVEPKKSIRIAVLRKYEPTLTIVKLTPGDEVTLTHPFADFLPSFWAKGTLRTLEFLLSSVRFLFRAAFLPVRATD
jgi:hypothetical protein